MARHHHPMWRKPLHHEDHENANDHVHWIELFYDLIHVVTIFLLGNYLSHHFSLDGFMMFTFLFLSVWIAWGDSSFFNSLYVSTDLNHRMIMAFQVCTVMAMAAAIPAMPGKGETYFFLAYGVNRALTAYLYFRAIKHNKNTSSLAYEMARNFAVFAVLFIISAFLPSPFNYIVFIGTLVLLQYSYLSPTKGVMRHERFVPRIGHLSERFALLLLIALGEGFFKMVLGMAEKGVYKASPELWFNFILGGISLFVLCWCYFDFVGNGKLKNHTRRNIATWWYGSMLVMLAAVMLGVALTGEVKVNSTFLEPYPFKYAILGCTGLALYIAALSIIQHTLEHRVAHNFASMKLRIAGIVIALGLLLIVQDIPSIVGNAIWFSALGLQVFVPLLLAYRHFGKED